MAGGPDGRGRGALVGALGKVGRDGRGIGGDRLVAGGCSPFGPPFPSGAVLRAGVGGAAVAERLVDTRAVRGTQCGRQRHGERRRCGAELVCAVRYHHL